MSRLSKIAEKNLAEEQPFQHDIGYRLVLKVRSILANLSCACVFHLSRLGIMSCLAWGFET